MFKKIGIYKGNDQLSNRACSLKKKKSTAEVHQMRPLCRHSFIIIFIIVVVVGHLKSFQPQKRRFSSFENNTGPIDRRTDGRTDRRTDGRTDIPSYRDARTHLKMETTKKAYSRRDGGGWGKKWETTTRKTHADVWGIMAVSYTHLTLPTICSV